MKIKETCPKCGKEIKSCKVLIRNDFWVCAACYKNYYDTWG